jgi:hypothetical protein
MNELTINGEVYIKKTDLPEKTEGDYVVVRTYSAGVHAGILESRDGKEVVLRNTRRLWYWKGAASLSQIAGSGISETIDCKFPAAIDKIILTEAIEIIPCTERARSIIESVPAWEK